MSLSTAVRAAFDNQPVVRMAAAFYHLRIYVTRQPEHPLGLCNWLAVRGVDGHQLIREYRTACGEKPPFFKWVDNEEGCTTKRLGFARKLLADIEAYLAGDTV